MSYEVRTPRGWLQRVMDAKCEGQGRENKSGKSESGLKATLKRYEVRKCFLAETRGDCLEFSAGRGRARSERGPSRARTWPRDSKLSRVRARRCGRRVNILKPRTSENVGRQYWAQRYTVFRKRNQATDRGWESHFFSVKLVSTHITSSVLVVKSMHVTF